jgi:N-acetylglucosaminyl-diphospho-decaprenol L-rhamnosyltransferase
MKLSIIILCWNDLKVIGNCLASIYANTHSTEFEVIVSDNGSTDGSIESIRKNFPRVRLIENGRNLRFAKGNNVAIAESRGEYVLILNPDTLIHDGALDTVIAFADKHPEAGAFGCKVLNADGTYQGCIRPLRTVRSEWCLALGLRPLARLSDWFHPGEYVSWKGDTERTVGWLAGCFIVARGELLKRIGGFDEQFFYFYEDEDLCRRIWEAGYPILYTPSASITHLGGESTNKRFPPIGFALDSQVTRYLYYYKYEGRKGVRSSRRAILASLLVRRVVLGLIQIAKPTEAEKKNQKVRRALFDWNYRVDPVRLVESGEEPEMEIGPMDRVLER